MPPDQARTAEVQAWLAKVAADLRAAEHDLAADPPLLEDSLFHSQQAAEKTLKAFLTSRSTSFRKWAAAGFKDTEWGISVPWSSKCRRN